MHSYYFIFVTYHVYLVPNIFTSNRKRTTEYFSSTHHLLPSKYWSLLNLFILTAIGTLFFFGGGIYFVLIGFCQINMETKSKWKDGLGKKEEKNGEPGKAVKSLPLSLLAETAAWTSKNKAEQISFVIAIIQLSGASKYLWIFILMRCEILLWNRWGKK